MSDTALSVSRSRADPPATGRAVLPVWPLVLLFALMPLWWALGALHLGWPLFGLVLAALLLVRGGIAWPAGTACWLVLLGLVTVSATRIDRLTGVLTFGLRLGYLFTALTVLLYVYNLARDRAPWSRIFRPLCLFWLAMVALGWLGVLAPTFSAASPVQLLMPPGVAGERFIVDLTHLDATEFNPQSRSPIYRPAAPYPYTNNWGTAYSLLVPCVVAYLTSVRRGPLRAVLLVSLPLSVVPAFLTLNRGMFIGLGVGLGYLAARAIARGRPRLLVPVMALVGVGWLISLVIPVGRLITARITNTDATYDRLDLYAQTAAEVLRSPLLGYGVPTIVDTTHAAEPLGTQGMVWQLVYSHGIPALLCFYLLLLVVARRLAAAVSPTGQWLGTVPVIALAVTPFYSYVDLNLSVIAFALGLGLAAVDGPVNRDPAPATGGAGR
ncbi:MAG TPA: O-antigen ligase family protein [Catenuloplanes sp.]